MTALRFALGMVAAAVFIWAPVLLIVVLFGN